MMRASVIAATFGFVALVGCSDEVTYIPNAAGAGGSGAGTTTSTTTSSGGSDACSVYDDDDTSLGELTIRFRNESGQTVYLPTVCGVPTLQFGPEGGGANNHAYVYTGSCLQTCEDLQTEGQVACGACQETTIQLSPGSTWDFEWRGFLLQSSGMEAACWLDGTDGGSCPIELAAEAGTYRATAEGFAECSQGGDACACTDESECFGSPSGMQAISDLGEASFPQDDVIEVVFGACAFGCPEG